MEIPSFEPVGRAGAVDHSPAAAMTSAAAIVARAGRLLRPRGDRGVTHRRLVDLRDGAPSAAVARPGDAGDDRLSTFRGSAARFVALG